ncbi:hypothetical protein AS850_15440 [Frondihabitans sp. 762G35]|uniref:hypothetical protein n=1 Tax=Frondihabitans sp. 762G35 TaxID=1446794 RepID=UPI000D20256F|nr:hypothetical protein [Frondihabitans sp. 762G35]ARC58480.1 hypothetical protein AS850_15440 [Frondihabitans sp. 762G35]
MRVLLAPLRRRRVWVTFVVIAVAGSLLVLLRHGSGVRTISGLFVVLGLATLAGGFVAYTSNLEPDHRPAALEGLDQARRKGIRRAVVSGDLSVLDASDRIVAADFADAYVASVPRAMSPLLLIMAGGLLQGIAQLVRWDGSWIDWAFAAEIAVVVGALAFGVPRQVRWLANARRVAARGVGPTAS